MPFATMGELIDALTKHGQKNHLGEDFWIRDVEKFERDNYPGEWEQFREKPIAEEEVISLASALREAISVEAGHWSEPEPYHDTLQRGHDFLRLLFLIAHDQGLQVSIGQIDGPLTFSEQMEVAGFINIIDGHVQLTPEAIRMIEEFKRQIEES